MSSGILALSFRHSQGQRLLSWHRLLGGSWGGRCPSLADYVRGAGGHPGVPAAGGG